MKASGTLTGSALLLLATSWPTFSGDARAVDGSIVIILGEVAYLELANEIPGKPGPAVRLDVAPATSFIKVTLMNASDGQTELRLQTTYNPSIGLDVRCQPANDVCTEMQRVHVTRRDGRILKLGDDVKSVLLSNFYIPRIKKSVVPAAAQQGVAAGGDP